MPGRRGSPVLAERPPWTYQECYTESDITERWCVPGVTLRRLTREQEYMSQIQIQINQKRPEWKVIPPSHADQKKKHMRTGTNSKIEACVCFVSPEFPAFSPHASEA